MLFYCLQRGLSAEEAVALVVNGFVRDVLQQLPMEFMAETQKLIGVSLEGSVGHDSSFSPSVTGRSCQAEGQTAQSVRQDLPLTPTLSPPAGTRETDRRPTAGRT